MRVAYQPHLTHNHLLHVIEAHRAQGTTMHGRGAFGRWLKHAAGSVAHAVTHSAIGQSLVEDGAKALGAAAFGPQGAAAAGNLAHSLMQAHAHGAAPPTQPGRPAAPAPGGIHQPVPVSNPTSASANASGEVESGFGVQRAPAKKRKPRRPF